MITLHATFGRLEWTIAYHPEYDDTLRRWIEHPRYEVKGPQKEIDKYLREQEGKQTNVEKIFSSCRLEYINFKAQNGIQR